MAKTVVCPQCGTVLEWPESAVREPVQCPHCRSTFSLPDLNTQFRAGPPPAVAFTAEAPPTSLGPIPDSAWQLFPGITGESFLNAPQRRLQPHRGTTILLFAVVSLLPFAFLLGLFALAWANEDPIDALARLGCLLAVLLPFGLTFAILALSRAEHDLHQIHYGTLDPAGESRTRWGKHLAYVSVFFWTLVTLAICLSRPNRF